MREIRIHIELRMKIRDKKQYYKRNANKKDVITMR